MTDIDTLRGYTRQLAQLQAQADELNALVRRLHADGVRPTALALASGICPGQISRITGGGRGGRAATVAEAAQLRAAAESARTSRRQAESIMVRRNALVCDLCTRVSLDDLADAAGLSLSRVRALIAGVRPILGPEPPAEVLARLDELRELTASIKHTIGDHDAHILRNGLVRELHAQGVSINQLAIATGMVYTTLWRRLKR